MVFDTKAATGPSTHHFRTRAVRILFVIFVFNLAGCQKTKDKVGPFFEKTREERLLDRYGQCEPAGYGFLLETVPKFLPAGVRPVIRYFDFDRKTHYWFNPPRLKIDSNYLVGVGFPKEELGKVTSISAKFDAEKKLWVFQTGTDYEFLDKIEFKMPASGSGPVQVDVLDNVDHGTVLFKKNFRAVLGLNSVETKISQFALSKGATSFAVRVQGIQPESTTVYISAIKLDDFTILKHEGACFLAQKKASIK